MKNLLLHLFYLSVLMSVLSSCHVYKEQAGISYLSHTSSDLVSSLSNTYALKIKPDDELQINISSTIPQATSLYNLPAVNYIGRSDTQVSSTNPISTYTVSESGHIVIPNLGKIEVAGSTPEEVAERITSLIKETVNDPIVKVDLKNFHVVVLGAVASPGTKRFSGQRCSVFDAIGAAGDVTLHGRRDNIVLMRENDGVVATHVLDLTDSEFLNSPYYYLQQNDVLVVDATDIQKENSTYNTMNSFRLQMYSTIVSAISVVVSLGIALLIK